ncbi:helix-turn-helix domain-containing protein [Parabacteroides goldsteinii]|uniref:helix-turn-helix domain-containing protein n=1 Tax=Parabacteroides goldsteinii TaxID=328812 RepID=UPI001898E96F|nr:helix-turn-helix domain-containing protein [Parabacteroides goldsteinii]
MPESISQFYKRIQLCPSQPDATYSKEKSYFNIFSRQCNFGTVQFSYREFYKITLIIGVGKLYYADKWILVNRPALLFSNPLVPYAWESISEEQKGMFCIFNEQFVQSEEKNGSLANTPLFKITGDKVFFLDDTQVDKVLDIYMQMQEENQSGYVNKSDVLRCYLHLLIHTALKMQDFNQYESFPNASQRITELFIELLDRQFPIDYPHAILNLRTPADYANRLSVHINHLNKVVKDTTGKTTSEMIAERITKECTQYLLHSNLSISEIAYSLGFETVSYFSKFYRKHTGKSPSEIREQAII